MSGRETIFERYKSLAGGVFHIALSDGTSLALTLRACVEIKATFEGTKAFRLDFIASGERGYLGQGIYQVQGADGETDSLFLCPRGPDGQNFKYDVLFN